MEYDDNVPGEGIVSECINCGTMILPEDQGIIPMLCTSAKVAGPSFFLAHFCCEKCLQAFVDKHTGGKINVLPCIVFPETVDVEQFDNLIKLELRSVSDDNEEEDDDDYLFDYDEDEVRDHNDFMIDDEYYDSDNDYDYGDDDEEDEDYGDRPYF